MGDVKALNISAFAHKIVWPIQTVEMLSATWRKLCKAVLKTVRIVLAVIMFVISMRILLPALKIASLMVIVITVFVN
jgi:hypothetical protein